MLPPHNLIFAQVADVCNTGLTPRFDQHPTDVGVPESLVGIVRVQVGVGVPVVGTVTPGPPFDRTLDSASASHRQSVLERFRCIVRPVSP